MKRSFISRVFDPANFDSTQTAFQESLAWLRKENPKALKQFTMIDDPEFPSQKRFKIEILTQP